MHLEANATLGNLKEYAAVFGRLALWFTYRLNRKTANAKMCSWVASELYAAVHAEQQH